MELAKKSEKLKGKKSFKSKKLSKSKKLLKSGNLPKFTAKDVGSNFLTSGARKAFNYL